MGKVVFSGGETCWYLMGALASSSFVTKKYRGRVVVLDGRNQLYNN
jgi:hypothetical protein